MNIIVTTPKSEDFMSRQESCDQIGEGAGHDYWSRAYNFKPKVRTDDKIFFSQHNHIQGFSLIIGVDPLPKGFFICRSTGRKWKGNWKLKFNMWFWLPNKPYYQGFRGVRYIPRIKDQKFVRNLYTQVNLIIENLEQKAKDLQIQEESQINIISNNDPLNLTKSQIDQIIKVGRPRENIVYKLKRLNVAGY